MNYWDSSPIIALLVGERSARRYRAFANDPIITWWGTPLECVSALARREREGEAAALVAEAYRRLEAMRAGWQEVHPGEGLRRAAIRLLKHYPLRAGDALQLAAASVVSNFEPREVRFVTEDRRLQQAAAREGFLVE